MVKIFVGGLPPEVSEMDLVIFISIHAEVVTIKIVRDKITRKSKGYAFLEMTSQAEAQKAVSELNGVLFKGNTLTVKISEESPASKPGNKTIRPVYKKKPRL